MSRTAAAAVCPCFLSIPYYHLRSTFCNLSLHVKASFEMDHIMSLSVAQVADLFFGADAYPHDYLHEVLFWLLAVGWIGAATQNLVNKVCMTGTTFAVYCNVFACVQLLHTWYHNLLLYEFSQLCVHQLICKTVSHHRIGMYVYHTHVMAMLTSAGSSREQHAG